MMGWIAQEGQGVVAEGSMGPDGTFTATNVLAKHDENYIPREVVDALKAQGEWRPEAGSLYLQPAIAWRRPRLGDRVATGTLRPVAAITGCWPVFSPGCSAAPSLGAAACAGRARARFGLRRRILSLGVATAARFRLTAAASRSLEREER